MRCLYCYEGDKLESGRMSDATLRALISKVGKHSINTGAFVEFIWHGGESLLVGLDFYKRVVKEQKAIGPGFRYINSIQTNGILLDGSFADFFVKNNFGVGVSIDGPPVIHDAQRLGVDATTGTFKQAYSALVEMDNRGQRPGALTVFTRNTLEHLNEFYEFFRDRSLNVKIIPLVFEGRAKDGSSAHLQVTPKEYGDALVYLFDRWASESKSTFAIDPLAKIVRSVVSGKNTYSCVQAGKCYNYFKVFPGGDVHLCGLQPYGEYTLGNINREDVFALMSSPIRKEYSQIKAAMKKVCRKCEHFGICNGGCTRSAYSSYLTMPTRDYYCESFKNIFSHIKNVVPKNVALAKSLMQSFNYE